jgi:hypothetical protein
MAAGLADQAMQGRVLSARAAGQLIEDLGLIQIGGTFGIETDADSFKIRQGLSGSGR